MNLSDIRAKRGDRILPKWKKLLEFISNTGIVSGPGVKITRGPNGTQVSADHFQRPWAHPFKVSFSSDEAIIRNGLVNGISPYIGETRISGLDDDGEEVEVPLLDLTYLGGFRSSINIVITVEEGESIELFDSPGRFYLDHSVITDDLAGGAEENFGMVKYPIAQIYWDQANQSIRKTVQVVHHNLGHRFLQGDSGSGRPARHLFWAT